MANSANPEINKKIATSALGTLVIATVFFYLGDRYAETLVTYPGQIFDHLSDAFLSMWQTIKDAPFALDMTSNSLLFGGACFLIIWMIWLRYVAFIGNYRSGEESGSARWGTLKEGKKFKDLQTEDNNLLFTKNFGLALHRPKFDPEYDRKSHIHDWSITYKTVHHDAVTHTEHVAPVYQNLTTYHTVCNECKQVIDGKADDHIKQTGHSGYSTNVPITDEVMVSEGYDKQVTDTPAYDETVIDKLVCTTCGATKDAPQATSDAAK